MKPASLMGNLAGITVWVGRGIISKIYFLMVNKTFAIYTLLLSHVLLLGHSHSAHLFLYFFDISGAIS